MADSSHVDSNVITTATDSTGATVVSVVQTNVTESSRVESVITTGGVGSQGPQGIQGNTGAQGPAGDTGPAGPNQVTTSTSTNVTGLLKGNGSAISAASAGTDYYAPGSTDVSVADGGTGASTASGAFTALKQDATTSATGVVQLTGDLMGTATSPLVKSRIAYVIGPTGHSGGADAVATSAADVAINAAITAGYLHIVLLPGSYTTTAKINLVTGLRLEAAVPGTVTITGANTDYTMIGTTKDSATKAKTNYSDIRIRGIKFVSQRGSILTVTNCTNPVVEDCYFSFSAQPLVRQCLTFIWCQNPIAERIIINTSAGNGVSFNGCSGGGLNVLNGYGGTNADDMVDVDTDFNDTNTVQSDGITLSNINVDTIGRGTGIRIEHALNVTLTNFNVKNVTAANSAGVYINTGGSFNQKDIQVSNGTVKDCTENGIAIEGSATENVTVSNVTIRNCGATGGTSVRGGVRIGAPNTVVDNVTVDTTAKSGTDGGGIIIYKYDSTVTSCTVKNCVTGIRAWNGDSLQSYAASTVTGNRFSGNTNDLVLTAFTTGSLVGRNYNVGSYANSLNELTLNNAISGSSPTVTPNGPDTNLGMTFISKGTGRTLFRPGSDATNAVSFQNAGVTNTILDIDTTNLRVGIQTTTPTSSLFVNGSLGLARGTVNDTNQTLSNTNCYIAFSAQTAQRTITLPDSTSNAGRIYMIADELGVAGTTNIIVATTSSQNIDGSTTYTINANYGYVVVMSVGGAWKVISKSVASGGSVSWGSITGTLSSQSDLQTALNAKTTKGFAIAMAVAL